MNLSQMIHDVKTFIQYMYQAFRSDVWQVIVLSSFNALLTGAGILMILPLLSLTSLPLPNQTKVWMTFPSDWSFSRQLAVVLVLYFVLICMSVWVNRKATLASVSLLQRAVQTLRGDLFTSLFSAETSDVVQTSQSRYISLFTVEINRISLGIQGMIQLMTLILVAIPQLLIAFYLSPMLTMYVWIGGALLFVGFYQSMKHVRQLGISLQHLNRDLQQAVQDQLNGMKEIRSYGAEQRHISDFQETTEDIRQNITAFTVQQTKVDSAFKIGAALLISLFLGFGLLAFSQDIASLLVILLIFSRLWPSFSNAQRHLQSILSALPSFEAYHQALAQLQQSDSKHSVEPISFARELRFENVSFQYPEHRGFSLQHIDITIQAGTTVALTGHSGSGKSTCLDLLLGFHQPTSGRLLIDDRVLSSVDQTAWFELIAYIPQHPYLFDGTIEENLRKWHPNLTDEALHEVIDMAEATFVYNLPNGLQTRIGDFGHSLSGGERQRIVLARALAKRPKLLILDEATGAVDEAQEMNIYQTLHRLKHEMTIIYITHRKEVSQLADQMIYLEQGKIVKRGDLYAPL
ncbi:ABC transporter ATP-binding protein [Exiguobacterium aestuarii]|uniref:ABC transporter ATP-binding protein n=1 Tax=Exiguobacterium aestuarii TaxID=273527 RepID=A0ABW2PKM9_9BACL|nr:MULTISPECIES: ABC transporter ATP-binding protein [Exiguobacterium]MCT4785131.1 ABC transporter ATP-binding protein/permease [Exiguobacterium aestuarii]